MNNKVIEFLSILKTASISKKTDLVRVENTRRVLICVEKMYEEGLILYYTLEKLEDDKKSYIKIKLREIDGDFITKKIKIVSKKKRNYYFTYEEICKLNTKNKDYFFYTDRGFVTLRTCRLKRLGGLLAFQI